MSKLGAPSSVNIEELDRFYRAGGLRRMASPHVHYHDPECLHPGCTHKMAWIDFQLELYGDPEHIYEPLVRAWWEGTGFAGRCPRCNGWIRFRTLRIDALTEDEARQLPQLPEKWYTVAQFA
jgi:hypothetical protein